MKREPKIVVQKHKTLEKVFLNSIIQKIFIGEIKGDTLRVYDNDNYHDLSKSLGLDDEVIESPYLKYRWLHFHYENNDYKTTRTYFYHKAKHRHLFNTRKQKFLPLSEFGILKASAWEEYMDNLATAQLDIFKVMDEQRKTGETNNEYLKEWEDSNRKVKEYELQKTKLVL